MARRTVGLQPSAGVERPLQAELFPVVNAQLDLWGVWWRPAGRRRVARLRWFDRSAGVVTPAEVSRGRLRAPVVSCRWCGSRPCRCETLEDLLGEDFDLGLHQ